MEKIEQTILEHNYRKLQDKRCPIDEYLEPRYDVTKHYRNLKDLDQAAALLITSIEQTLLTDKIMVFIVDIDNDGISSGTIIHLLLTNIFKVPRDSFVILISSRKYRRGLNPHLMSLLATLVNVHKIEFNLIATADMGSPDEEYYRKIKELYPNTKILLTDHHQIPEDNYPVSVDVVINPHKPSNKDYKALCGCATMYLVLRRAAQLSELNVEKLDKLALPYVATATLTDVMSMGDIYNRYLVQQGLKYINTEPDRNFTIYRKLFGIRDNFTYIDLGKSIGPLINTANRLSKEEFTLRGLTASNDDTAARALGVMYNYNKNRKAITKVITMQAEQKIDKRYTNAYVVDIETELFISGLIASRLSSDLRRPVIVFNNIQDKEVIEGSARAGVNGLNVLSIFKSLPNTIVVAANGHTAACGISIYKDKLEEFKQLLDIEVGKALESIHIEQPTPWLKLDYKGLCYETYLAIERCSPYGLNWEEPLCTIDEYFTITKITPIQDFFLLTLKLDNRETEYTASVFFSNIVNKDIGLSNFLDKFQVGDRVRLNFRIGKDKKYKDKIMLEVTEFY